MSDCRISERIAYGMKELQDAALSNNGLQLAGIVNDRKTSRVRLPHPLERVEHGGLIIHGLVRNLSMSCVGSERRVHKHEIRYRGPSPLH